jgi:KDO2-lipid IV(A) lauroyltransferase
VSTRPGPVGRLLIAVASLAARLPPGPLNAAADAAGELWYRLAPAKRAQARANLGRVCDALAASGTGSRTARRAATDPDALERLVRACFRHTARYYLEVARTGAYDLDTALATLEVLDEDAVRTAFTSGPMILVGMHYGAIELPVVYVAHLVGRNVTAPMETVADPVLQRWFVTSRSRVGVDIIPLRDARRALLAALHDGRSVGLVADRDITGSGTSMPLFGHPAPIPAGPALLAVETGVPIRVAAARRLRDGRYVGRMIALPRPVDGPRRERVAALMAAMVAAFEDLLADAPEQWWGALHPIWPDLVVAGRGEAAE